MLKALKSIMPWYLKLAIKVGIGSFPRVRQFLRRIGVFQRGRMTDPEAACEIFMRQYEPVETCLPEHGFSYLEIGPGDSIATAVLAAAVGGRAGYLVDVQPPLFRDAERYSGLVAVMQRRGLKTDIFRGAASIDDLLGRSNATFLTEGLKSLLAVEAESVDVIFSHHSLEHVRLAEFDELLRCVRRVLRPGGCCYHAIDLRDHLANGLNNLRFQEAAWESDAIARSGVYTNRIRYADMLDRFRRAGFAVDVVRVEEWDDVPLARRRMNAAFAGLPDEDLCVAEFDVILKPI